MKNLAICLSLLVLFQNSFPEPIIFLNSIPKAGSFLLAKTVHLITGKAHKGISSMNIKDYQSNKYFYSNHVMANQSSLDFYGQPIFKGIFIYRDPRDQIISFIHWMKKVGKTFWGKVSFNDCFYSFIQRAPRPHYNAYTYKEFYENFLPWQNVPNFLTVRFEDLIGYKGAGDYELQLHTIKKIADYLEVSLSNQQVVEIAAKLFGGTYTFRVGQIGQWRKIFDKNMKVAFKKHIGDELLIGLGYELDEEWLKD